MDPHFYFFMGIISFLLFPAKMQTCQDQNVPKLVAIRQTNTNQRYIKHMVEGQTT